MIIRDTISTDAQSVIGMAVTHTRLAKQTASVMQCKQYYGLLIGDPMSAIDEHGNHWIRHTVVRTPDDPKKESDPWFAT